MQPSTPHRAELLGTTIRRLLRRGARGKISKMLGKVRPEDVAVMLRGFTPSEQFTIFQTLIRDYPQGATEVVLQLEPEQRLTLLDSMTPEMVAQLLEMMAVDDAVFLLDSLPPALKEKVLEIVDLEERFAAVQAHFAYREESAGRIMDTEFLALEEDTSISQAVAKVRQFARGEGMLSYLYVVDSGGRLIGVASIRQLLVAEPEETLGQVMNTSVIKVHTETDQEEVAQLASRYDLLAIPVTNDDNKLVGIVTVDDIIDVFKEEATEDFYKIAGTTDDELVYQDRSFKVAGLRLPWILFNLAGLLIAAAMTARFEETIQIALMVGFIPVIMGMAGNVGSQTSTISVRGLATGRLAPTGRVRTFLWQQIKVGVLLALACSSLVATVAIFFVKGVSPYAAGLTVGMSLFLTIILASLNGVLIPVVFKRVGFDPALAAGPLVTTMNDVFGILVYFSLTRQLFQLFGV